MVKGRRFVLKQHFQGLPKLTDFELVEEDLGELTDGEIYFETEFISVDPYQRPYTARHATPMTMMGSIVAIVKESKDKKYPVGTRIVSYAGWVECGKLNPAKMTETPGLPGVVIAPDIGSLAPSLLLGACGMPGNTAYFGLLEICHPKEGETVLVNGAAGAVGSLVGQIAKIKGCKVIGYAGSEEKVAFLKELGFDHAFNYKKISAQESIKQAAPNGIDCFFDNVGGPDSSVVLSNMNNFGRASICGAISTYNDETPTLAPAVQGSLVFKQLKMEGFLVPRWIDRWDEGILQMAKWIQEGKIKTKETVVDGFENTPKAFIGLFTGENIGKMVVKVK